MSKLERLIVEGIWTLLWIATVALSLYVFLKIYNL